MATRRVTLADVPAVLGIGIFCLPILHFLPAFEQSQTEARITQAYIDVRRIRDQTTAPVTDGALAKQDPWGVPYRIVSLPNGAFRVLSSGPNQSSPAGNTDRDDIYSDMPTHPVRDKFHWKTFQIQIVLGAAIAMWFLLTALYLWFRRRTS